MTDKQNSITGSTIYSHFRYLCPYHTWLLFNVELLKETPTPSDRLLMESGIRHEDQALRYFQKKYGDGCILIQGKEDLSQEQNIKLRSHQTLRAMEEGKAVIYHGILVGDESLLKGAENANENPTVLRGETDFLFRVDEESQGRFTGYHYEVGDAKSSRSSKFCQQMQVTFYSWLLETIQGVRPQCGKILTRPLGIENEPTPFKEELFLIDDHIWTLMSFLEEEFCEIMAKEEGEFFFHPKSSCETCLHYDYCRERASASNDLSLLPDIRKIQKRHLNKVGVREISDLPVASDSKLKKAARATGVTFQGLEKLRRQALSTVEKRPVSRGIFETPQEACMAITESELDLPGEKEGTTAIDFTDPALAHVYFDMESDPYSGVEYLFGLMVDHPGKGGRRRKGKAEFFTAHSYSPDEEYGAFYAFLKRMETIKNKYGDEGFAIFHYAHYEPTHLMKLAEKYQERSPGLIDRVDYLNRRMVDVYKLIKKSYYLPLSSYSIKEVAPCIKELMAKDGLKGGHTWKKLGTVQELEKELKKSRWSEKEISESIKDVKEMIKGFELEDEAMIFDASADMSIVWFNLYTERKKKIWMRLIEIYNEDDLVATRALVEWLLFMQKETRTGTK